MSSATPRTMLGKLWERHLVGEHEAELPDVLFIDLHLIHEVTSPQAFATLREHGLAVRHPGRTIATMDHSTPTTPAGNDGRPVMSDLLAAAQLAALEANCREFGVRLEGFGSGRRGVVHVMAPELGLVHPGMTVVCGDSHTSTHGALGALAFGIGSTEVGHVLATQCLLAKRPASLEVRIDGALGRGVTAKDVALAMVAVLGAEGGGGSVIEFTGATVRALDVEGRMTLCNMSIEAGARAGLVAPDEKTFTYLEGRPHAPAGAAWQRSVEEWRALASDPGAEHQRAVMIEAGLLEPMVTYGTNPSMAIGIGGRVPAPDELGDPSRRRGLEQALAYMGLRPGMRLVGHPVDLVFLGSCTNGRLADLRDAAGVLRGRKLAPRVRMLVVPGSYAVKRAAEAEGLDRVFREAGAEWREPGCSMCLGMNDDHAGPGVVVVSTSNRNFEGRQGPGSRTILASPLTAAATAVRGCLSDVRELL